MQDGLSHFFSGGACAGTVCRVWGAPSSMESHWGWAGSTGFLVVLGVVVVGGVWIVERFGQGSWCRGFFVSQHHVTSKNACLMFIRVICTEGTGNRSTVTSCIFGTMFTTKSVRKTNFQQTPKASM
jgi:hypothetical protein